MMTERWSVRAARPEDAAPCAAILNDWIDGTDWMPRVHTRENVKQHYREFVFRDREVLVIGNPVTAYLTLSKDNFVTSLYSGSPGRGMGRALLDVAKARRSHLRLWTFLANTGAQRFYRREGFAELDRSPGDNEEGLPDILFGWEAAG